MITVITITKPARVSATAYAYIVTDQDYKWNELVDAGLEAMDETRLSLWGFGVEAVHGQTYRDDQSSIPPGHYKVYAYRD